MQNTSTKCTVCHGECEPFYASIMFKYGEYEYNVPDQQQMLSGNYAKCCGYHIEECMQFCLAFYGVSEIMIMIHLKTGVTIQEIRFVCNPCTGYSAIVGIYGFDGDVAFCDVLYRLFNNIIAMRKRGK